MNLLPSGVLLPQTATKRHMADYVFDSSAALAILANESGAFYAAARISKATISAVNLIEVVTKLIDWGFDDDVIETMLFDLSLTVVNLDQTQALIAGTLRKQTRTKGLSLGDRACLALAQTTGRIALTADRAWVDLDVEAIR
jgi:ribonuclease VapC